MKWIIRLAICLLFLLVFLPIACTNFVDHDRQTPSPVQNKIQKSIQIGDIMTSRQFALYDALSHDHGYSYYKSRS